MVQLKYFGDNRDYFKYDLITSIFEASLLERYVFIPMLTDHRNDNEGRNGNKSMKLYEFINACQEKSLNNWKTWLAPYVTSYQTVERVDETYFRDGSRAEYWDQFKPFMNTGKALIFVDPDIGLETGGPSYLNKMGPEKYILDEELKELFGRLDSESILMIYQHLPKDENTRIRAIEKKLEKVKSVCNTELTCAYREGDLAFVFVAKSKEMFEQLLHLLDNYNEKSIHKFKNIVQLCKV